MRFIKKYLRPFLGTLVVLATQTSCQKRSSNSIIVIAVDSLSVSDISCSQRPPSRSGFALLCEEAVRFTHAYTPSVLSAPALASLLTGLYPFQHGLRHNGGPGLSPALQTWPEAAVEKSYRTGFFSGGAPILRKTGLHQGFEVFDDGVTPNILTSFKSFEKNVRSFTKWMEQELSSEPFAAVFYVPDLEMIDTSTVSPSGEPRSRSYDSQLEEFDTQLFKLIRYLKGADRWRDSVFILTGLNGRVTVPRPNEIPPLNLHAENTQVALFIKAPKSLKDTSLNWTIDRNVSLVDVGRTLAEWFGMSPQPTNSDFPTFSLREALSDTEKVPPYDRALLIESGWGAWKKVTSIRAAILSNQDYLIFDRKPRYYNLLTDRFELNPLPTAVNLNIQSSLNILQALGYDAFQSPEEKYLLPFQIPYMNWVDPSQIQSLKTSLYNLWQDDIKNHLLANWVAISAIESSDNKVLAEVAAATKNWQWFQDMPDDPCWGLVKETDTTSIKSKKCNETLFQELMAWIKTSNESSKEWARNRFMTSYYYHLMDRKIFKTNMGLYGIWDLSSTTKWEPTYTDIFLARKENQSLRQQILKALPEIQDED